MWATQAKENDTCAVSFSSCKGVRRQARRARTRGAFSRALPAVLFNPAVGSEQGRETVNTNKAFFKGVNYELPKQCDISATWVPLSPPLLTIRVDLSVCRLRKWLSNVFHMRKKKREKKRKKEIRRLTLKKKSCDETVFLFYSLCLCARMCVKNWNGLFKLWLLKRTEQS